MEQKSIPRKLQDFLANARVKHIPKDQIILYEGDQPEKVFMVKSGVVKLHSIDEGGNDKILHLLKAANVIPLAFFSGYDVACRWYYTALIDSELYVLPRKELEHLMYTEERVGRCLTNTFSEEVHEVLTRLDSLSKTGVGEKLTAALRYLVACHGTELKRGWYRIPFPVNHQLLADMIGMSRESTSICMKDLTTKKILRNPKLTQLEINLEKLKEYRQKLIVGK